MVTRTHHYITLCTACLVGNYHSILNRAENLIDCSSPWPHVSIHVLVQVTYIWAFNENCDVMHINTATAIKLGTYIVNVVCRMYINYYIIYLILNILFHLNSKTTPSPTRVYITWCFTDRESWIDYILITNLMHWILFIHKILFSSTCFEPQVLIFRGIQLYTCSIWYCHSLWEFLMACRYTAWVRTHSGCVPTSHQELS